MAMCDDDCGELAQAERLTDGELAAYLDHLEGGMFCGNTPPEPLAAVHQLLAAKAQGWRSRTAARARDEAAAHAGDHIVASSSSPCLAGRPCTCRCCDDERWSHDVLPVCAALNMTCTSLSHSCHPEMWNVCFCWAGSRQQRARAHTHTHTHTPTHPHTPLHIGLLPVLSLHSPNTTGINNESN